MNETTFSEYYDSGKHACGVDILKFWLMPVVILSLFGVRSGFGEHIKPFLNFAAPAFYIMCGFFVLCPDEDKRAKKTERAIKNSFRYFVLLAVFYFLLNLFYLASSYNYMGEDMLGLISKRIIFDFLVFNMWPATLPIGISIWFIHSLFYAYVFFYIADKLKLLRFCAPMFVLFYIVTLFTGELSRLAGFPYFGYTFIPGGAVTRAIPYMLLGMLVRKHADRLLGLSGILYVVMFLFGAAAAYAEYRILAHFEILTYYGHLMGHGIMALALCLFALSDIREMGGFASMHGRSYAKRIYVLCQPVYVAIMMMLPLALPVYAAYIREYICVIVYLVCLLLAFAIGYVRFNFLP